jgi:hypothetical protein
MVPAAELTLKRSSGLQNGAWCDLWRMRGWGVPHNFGGVQEKRGLAQNLPYTSRLGREL